MRESFNLRTKIGRRCFFRSGWLGDEWARKFVIGDTLRNR